MREPNSTDFVIAIIFLIIGLILSPFILRTYHSYEYTVNTTNPLFLDYDFLLCNKGKYSDYFVTGKNFNLITEKIDFDSLCSDRCNKYSEDLLYKHKWNKNLSINCYMLIDDFFSDRERKVITNSSRYILEKLSKDGDNVIIKVTDKGRNKKYIWQN